MANIFGIGVDIIDIYRFEKVNLQRFAKRILTQKELVDFENAKNKKNFIAKKFSVKEAVAKAFGVGIGKNLSFYDIEISKDEAGKPVCFVKNSPLNLSESTIKVHISISDAKNLISTYCIVEVL